MKILVLTKYSKKGASSRLRFMQYIPFLKAEGIEVTVSSLFDDIYLANLYSNKKRLFFKLFLQYLKRLCALTGVFQYDLIWIESELFPGFPALFERLFNFFGVRFVVDYDDAIFHNYDLSNNKAVRAFLSRKIDTVMWAAHTVVAGNQYLANRALLAGSKKVVIIPTVIDLQRYEIEYEVADRSPVIGWIGSPLTQKYLLYISNVLDAVCKKSGAKLLLVGADKNIVSSFRDSQIEVVDWSDAHEVELIKRFDIGIMPLPDLPWERGKCGYKLIQYMACAKPIVASPVGVNVEIVNKNKCGYLASTSREWEEALSSLLSSRMDRVKFGAAGRHSVETNYCVQVQALKLLALFRNIGKVDNP